ncbi:hypothetical protein KEM48_007200 [Puccinia striiformis f. sp. tritici PST-130]|nr:hypothetical protein KEM48_007200 [Puccinia striiformis f. sp. tritici PST-130]
MAQPVPPTQRSEPVPEIPRLLILDADDSYTRNILDLILGVYPAQHAQLESRVLILRANRFDWSTLSTQIIPHFAAIILVPVPVGLRQPLNPVLALLTPLASLLDYFLQHSASPTGHRPSRTQVLHGQLSELELELDSSGRPLGVLDRLQQGTSVVRYNSLTVDPSSISEEVQITAWAQDGPSSRTVMALAHKTLPFHSVQFHPESVCSTDGSEIVRSFFQVVSDSPYVNSETGIGRTTAYSSLPDDIIQLSEIRKGTTDGEGSVTRPKKKSFQLRSLVFKNSILSPEDVFTNSIRSRSPLGHVWLDSADSLTAPEFIRQDRCSHMGSVDFLVSYFAARKSLSIRAASDQQGSDQQLEDSITFWDWLRLVQDELQACTATMPPCEDPVSSDGINRTNGSSNNTEFVGAPVGFMGYIGYELLSESLAHYNLPCRSSADVPDAELGFCNTALSYHHASSTWTASALVVSPQREDSLNTDFHQHFTGSVGLSDIESKQQQQAQEQSQLQPKMATRALESIVSESDYLEAITKAQAQIISGESYELCLTTQFKGELASTEGEDGHFGRYVGLRQANPAPYGAYVRFGVYDTTILSSSPERFLRVDQRGGVEMKPIKGTARRVLNDIQADQQAAFNLQSDPKERAENLMITDLVRHDLHGFCIPGTVKVTKLFSIETVATVHSLVSTVQGSLRPKLNPVDALQSSFPPGSMTGAPKLSSIEILDTLELHHPRGAYSGILGLFLNNHISVGGGGAITSLSRKDNEWKEVKLKVEAVQKSLNLAS